MTELPAGHLLALDHDVPHEIVAQADSAFLLTIAWPADYDNPAVRPGSLPDRTDKAAVPLLFDAVPRSAFSAATIAVADSAREFGLDKTLADTFPCSDPFSSIPDPLLEIA